MSMISIPGYSITEQIYNSSKTLIYRGQRLSDHVKVILKLPKQEYPSFQELLHFRHQYSLKKNLNSPYIRRCYGLESYGNRFVLVLEDFGGISLSEYIKQKSLSLKEFLEIAISLTYILEILSQNFIIHKDIKPANLLINPDTKQIKLIDFSISSLLPREQQEIKSSQVLEGTLAYISPEQTGKMNRGIDYRTDFYSLGVTFYEFLTGSLPFNTNDPVELVYCHLAKNPPNLTSDLIPQVLSNIVHKLMAKMPENRYQTALGLRYDLELCLQELAIKGTISDFKLGQKDKCDRFLIPEKLYGREIEVNTLLEAFDRISAQNETNNNIEMMLVAGFSGIGKTAVVNEIHKPIVRQRGYFIKGKFDQYKRNIPLNALVDAFQDLIKQLLTENNEQVKYWQDRLKESLGDSGQVIVDVIPELRLLIGSQPQLTQLSATESQNRFDHLFKQFIEVFTTSKYPLVIFLDDLQWVDSASLNMMQLLMTEKEGKLLLIGAYRDNEVSPTHPLILTLNDLKNKGAIVNEITLQPLRKTSLNQLIADTLKCELKQAFPLTELVNQKTQCNPFFATQFLKSLHNQGLIYFDRSQGGWECDISAIKSLSTNEDVVGFMAHQLQNLPNSTQNVLKLAACIGNQFNLETLAIVAEKNTTETASDLWNALQCGFILPLNDVYKFYQFEESESAIKELKQKYIESNHCFYRFYHDRIQQAAYFLIPESEKKQTHLKIGQLLLKNFTEEETEEDIFEIVNQLNIGQDLIIDQHKQIQLAQLNLKAGEKALNSSSQVAALDYFSKGLNLLKENSWETDYKLTLKLSEKAAESAYLNGDFNLTNNLIENVLEKAQNLLDKLNVYQVKIQANIAQSQLQEAVNTAFTLLTPLGVDFPENVTGNDVQLALEKTAASLIGKTSEELTELPSMVDVNKLAALETLATVASAAYIGFPQLYPLIILKQVDLSLGYGNSPNSAYAFATYGLILCAFTDDIDAGYIMGKLALKLLDKYQVTRLKAKVLNLVYPFIYPWKKHLRKSLKPLLKGYHSGLETGDLEFAAYCAYNHCSFSYFVGNELLDVLKEIEIYGEAIAKLKQNTALNFHNIYHQSVLNLLAENITETPYIWPETIYNNANDPFSLGTFYINKLIISYLVEPGKEDINTYRDFARKHLNGVAGYPLFVLFFFYDSLANLALYNNEYNFFNSPDKDTLKIVNLNQEKLKYWADHAPENCLHKYHLVEAEKNRVLGAKIKAIEHYEQAISLASENRYIQEQALAYELAAKFYLEWKKDLIAQTYLINAYYAYSRWGATAKIALLEKNYPQLLAPILLQKEQLKPGETLKQFTTETLRDTNISSSSVSSNSTILDLQTVMKASQTISSEIELNKLLSTLMQVIMENVGANHGSLILNQGENLQIVANCDSKKGCSLQPIPVENTQEIPVSIINYVWRTQEVLVINNVENNSNFNADIYLLSRLPKSLLCLPVVRKNKSLGILYLENSLTTNVFNSDRLEILKILVSQAAISIENAQLYEQLEENTFYDKLTGLPNRLYFLNLLKHSIQLAEQDRDYKYAVLFLDLDRFKIINESMGHTVGDELLKSFALRLKKCVEETTTVARFGGDEFAILLENMDSVYDAVKIAQYIQEELKKPFILNQYETFSTASIGITLSTIKYTKPSHVIRDADIAMYRAKVQARGRYEVFDPQMQANISKRLQLENDLRKGIANQEFSLFYQPIISLATGKLAGFEALIRWNHPQKGFISPGDFIPVAEETGAIIPIGYWVLKEACQQLYNWQQNVLKNRNIMINVNLSIKQFSEPNLVENIDKIIQETNLETKFLKLEITESAIMDNYKNALKILDQIKERNIQLCIDDFGTGYSSLSYLHQFPLDVLKIDRSFIRHIKPHSKNLEIVQGIISLAHSLEMKVVAEGVETQEQSDLLKGLSCEFCQGFFYAKPLDSNTATEFIKNN